MSCSKKICIASLTLAIIALLLGLLSLTWNIIYDSRSWNHDIFRENHYTDGMIGILSISILSLILFWVVYVVIQRRPNSKVKLITSYVLFGLYNVVALVLIIIVGYDTIHLKRDLTDVRLDKQLASEDIIKAYESVDSIIARTENYTLYDVTEPNKYMMLYARSGYAPAQNYIGIYFYEQAIKKNDWKYGYNNWDLTMTNYCQEELNRSTYWFLKAAEQNYGRAQENLGRIHMHDLLANQPYSFGDAKYWLTRASKNGIYTAYFYLGLLCQDQYPTEAIKYWQLGADKGDEDCMRMLENPDYL